MFQEVRKNHRLAVEISSFAAQNDLSAKLFPRTIARGIGGWYWAPQTTSTYFSIKYSLIPTKKPPP